MIDRVAAHRDAGDVADRGRRLRAEKARVLAERTVGRKHVGRHPALDHEFGVGRHHDPLAVRDRRHEPQRLAEHAARGAPVTLRIAQLRLRAHQHRRVVADPEGDRTGLAARAEFLQVARIVARRIGKPAHALRAAQPAALDRGVVDPGVGIEGRRMRGRQVGSGFELVLGQRRNAPEIRRGAGQHELLHGRCVARDHLWVDAARAASRKPLCGPAMIRQAERRGRQRAARGQIRDHRDRAARTIRAERVAREQNRIFAARIERVLQRCQLVAARQPARQLPHRRALLRQECPQVAPHFVMLT